MRKTIDKLNKDLDDQAKNAMTFAKDLVKGTTATNLAKNFKNEVGKDALDKAYAAEAKQECQTLEQAMKNPLFLKGIAVVMADAASEETNFSGKPTILRDKEFWLNDFLPKLFSKGDEIFNPKGDHNPDYMRAMSFIKSLDNESYLSWKRPKVQRFLERVLPKTINGDASANSLFRDASGTLDVNKVLVALGKYRDIKRYAFNEDKGLYNSGHAADDSLFNANISNTGNARGGVSL